ncbi:hypothetical protein [Leptospira sp. GIMC2001]|uniref:hypothetical protein n=1 Tax=Leptospira sp. GIMC2001 TaxID=1513297 RepID=UPI002349891E|nr:hypothetical protein [Leptospira sp. GIMC2001]WCL51157.1 hypothetical protein O4O04_10185 [Leptospira sp. GIMC2001]
MSQVFWFFSCQIPISERTYRKMPGPVSSMPVGDLFAKARLIFWGVGIPSLGFIALILFSPVLLKYGGFWKKADILVIELSSTSSFKQWKLIEPLHKKEIFDKVWIILPSAIGNDSEILIDKDANSRREKILQSLSDISIKEEKISFINQSEGESGSSFYISKGLIKNLVNDPSKSILVFTDEYKSQRILNTYKKNLNPIGIEVSIYPATSGYTSTNWFLTEAGVGHMTKELFLYIYYKFRGYY